MFNKRMLRNLDYFFIFVVVVLLGVSLLVMSTASLGVKAMQPNYYLKLQVVWIVTGIALLLGVVSINYQSFRNWSWWLYGLNLCLLLMVNFFGSDARGAARWIDITDTIAIQPSEFAKILIIVCFADFIAKRKGKLNAYKDFIPCFIYIGVPMLLVVMQPDLGTGMVFGAIMLGIMLVGGANPWKLASILLLIVVIAGGAIYAHLQWGLPVPLQDYQVKRIITFTKASSATEMDIRGDSYQVMQSMVAIGSGGMWGKGYREGTQGQLNFLPEHHTDFIFSVVAEEFGFIGSVTLLFLFFILVARAIGIAMHAKDLFGALIVVGVSAMFCFHLLVNVGMVSGLMPVTGIPLPLVSYGGSAMWSNMMAIGLVINVNYHKQKLMF